MYLFDVCSESGDYAPCKSAPLGKAEPACTSVPEHQKTAIPPGSMPGAQGRPVLEMLIARYGGPWVRAAELPGLFASWDLAHRCTKAGWITPVMRGPRRTIYRLSDITACMERIEAGERPPARGAR